MPELASWLSIPPIKWLLLVVAVTIAFPITSSVIGDNCSRANIIILNLLYLTLFIMIIGLLTSSFLWSRSIGNYWWLIGSVVVILAVFAFGSFNTKCNLAEIRSYGVIEDDADGSLQGIPEGDDSQRD